MFRSLPSKILNQICGQIPIDVETQREGDDLGEIIIF